MKRYVESDRWNDPWFRKLTGRNKLAWLFASQTSNACGVVKVDLELWAFTLGISNMDWEGFFKAIEERIVRLPGGDIWIPQVVVDHYGPLSRACRYHLPVIEFLYRHDLVNHPEIIWKTELSPESKGSEPLAKGCQPYPKGSEPLKESHELEQAPPEEPVKKKRKSRKRSEVSGMPPTLEQVAAYCQERKNRINPVRFHSFYSANGWVQNTGKPIVDWEAAVRSWENNPRADGLDLPSMDSSPEAEEKRLKESVAKSAAARKASLEPVSAGLLGGV